MRVSRQQAEKNRATVVETAGRLFRARGFDGIGIADIMKAAGLTQGGFYGQFQSKEHLAAEASEAAINGSLRKWQTVLSGGHEAPLEAIAAFYLQPAHRDHPERGCTFAALASDVARSGPDVKAVFGEGLERQVSMIETALIEQGSPPAAARDEALAAISTLVGALVLSRAVGDPAFSDQILAAATGRLTSVPDG